MQITGPQTTPKSLLRAMQAQDIAAGLRLCRASRWNQLEEDWRCFLDSEQGGGRLVEKDGEVVGTVTFLRYGGCFSWLSMMLVDPQHRGLGIGSELMEAALAALDDEVCVRLDATPAGEPLYYRYGFVPEYTLARMHVTVAAERLRPSPGKARPMEPDDLPDVFARDREIFGADRSALLASLFRRAPRLAWVAREGPSLVGHCFGRPGYRYAQLGPVVAETSHAAQELAAHCLAQHDGKRFAVDVSRLAPEWIPWMESAGFQEERTFLRMRCGENRHPGLPAQQFAIAGPEFG